MHLSIYQAGESLFVGEMTIEMSKYTKQYETYTKGKFIAIFQSIFYLISSYKIYIIDVTEEFNDVFTDCYKELKKVTKNIRIEDNIDQGDTTGIEEFGAVILRGNRIVLTRSLDNEWQGMQLPSVPANTGEDPFNTAIRAIDELCDIEEGEMEFINVPPVIIYNGFSNDVRQSRGVKKRGNITIFPMYATAPPPGNSPLFNLFNRFIIKLMYLSIFSLYY
jgi:hypothetical protein